MLGGLTVKWQLDLALSWGQGKSAGRVTADKECFHVGFSGYLIVVQVFTPEFIEIA